MNSEPITARQGDEIVRLLEKILAELKDIKSSTKTNEKEASDSEYHLRCIEKYQREK
jgi:hypothetical protein